MELLAGGTGQGAGTLTNAALARFQTPSAKTAWPGAPWRPSSERAAPGCTASRAAGPAPDAARERPGRPPRPGKACAPHPRAVPPTSGCIPAGWKPQEKPAGSLTRPCACARVHVCVCMPAQGRGLEAGGSPLRTRPRLCSAESSQEADRAWGTLNVWCSAMGRKGHKFRSA